MLYVGIPVGYLRYLRVGELLQTEDIVARNHVIGAQRRPVRFRTAVGVVEQAQLL